MLEEIAPLSVDRIANLEDDVESLRETVYRAMVLINDLEERLHVYEARYGRIGGNHFGSRVRSRDGQDG